MSDSEDLDNPMANYLAEEKETSKSLLGFRRWVLEDGKLKSIGLGSTVWKSSRLKAVCQQAFHSAPEEFCECGLYAYYSLQEEWMNYLWYGEAQEYPISEPETIVNQTEENDVIGLVAGKGHTYLHTDGFRSEEMQILGIINQFDSESKTVAEAYSVPLISTHKELFGLLKSIGKNNLTQVTTTDQGIFLMPESYSLNEKGLFESFDEQPALVLKNGSRFWAKDGLRHNSNGPSIQHKYKKVIYYKDGLRHCEEGPAYTAPGEDDFYYLDGELIKRRKWKRDPRVKTRLKAKASK